MWDVGLIVVETSSETVRPCMFGCWGRRLDHAESEKAPCTTVVNIVQNNKVKTSHKHGDTYSKRTETEAGPPAMLSSGHRLWSFRSCCCGGGEQRRNSPPLHADNWSEVDRVTAIGLLQNLQLVDRQDIGRIIYLSSRKKKDTT